MGTRKRTMATAYDTRIGRVEPALAFLLIVIFRGDFPGSSLGQARSSSRLVDWRAYGDWQEGAAYSISTRSYDTART